MVGLSKCWKVCGRTEKSRSDGEEKRVSVFVRFATVDVNMYCFGFQRWCLGYGILFRYGKMLQNDILSFAQPCVVLKGGAFV